VTGSILDRQLIARVDAFTGSDAIERISCRFLPVSKFDISPDGKTKIGVKLSNSG